jgi:5-methylthioribose kinase
LWSGFVARFADHWHATANDDDEGGALYALARRDVVLREAAILYRLAAIWQDTLGFAGCEIIRRILGLAHVADFESIEDLGGRAECERRALLFARRLIVDRPAFPDIAAVTQMARSVMLPE